MSLEQQRSKQSLHSAPDFAETLVEHNSGPLVREAVSTLQINVGKRCNQACHHCHVEAGPNRTEVMSLEVANSVVALLGRSTGIETLDITGGAPELNPNFRLLVAEATRLGLEVIDRCNLTVLFEPGMEDLLQFLAAHEVRIVASLPCYQAKNVDKQRGLGVFDKSIQALRDLNAVGYGHADSALKLDLVYNPQGATLPPPQADLEESYKTELASLFGIVFHNLFTITNMPIKRFAHYLTRTGQLDEYQALLVNHFNPSTIRSLMCRSLLSVSWDGRLYDCDFNQMLELPIADGIAGTSAELLSLQRLEGTRIVTGGHCFGCTAGAGSSCSGALE